MRAGVSMCVAMVLGVAVPLVAADGPRETRTVKLVRKCLPAVVSIQLVKQVGTARQSAIGSGSIVHASGYILTNHHVVAGMVQGRALLATGRAVPVRLVAALPHRDLAILKADAGAARLPVLALGRSHDLMLGEPVLAMGNPSGLSHTVSNGIVSGLNRTINSSHGTLPSAIQTTARIAGGSSGGPLINAEGKQIGVVTASGGGFGFAIPVDQVRQLLPSMLAIPQRTGGRVGVALELLADGAGAPVRSVAEGSAAAKAGLRPGDRIVAVDGAAVGGSLDLLLSLLGARPGQVLRVRRVRGEETADVRVTVEALALPAAVKAPASLAAGLRFRSYTGRWRALPDTRTLTPATEGVVAEPTLAAAKLSGDGFAVTFQGFVRIPKEGAYTFATTSDDGSRLTVAGRRLVDNDGLHGARTVSGTIRLPAGLHALRIDYFERDGGEQLAVHVQGPGLAHQPLAGALLVHAGE